MQVPDIFSPFQYSKAIKVRNDVNPSDIKYIKQEKPEIKIAGDVYQADYVSLGSKTDGYLSLEKLEFKKAENGGVIIAFSSPLKENEVISIEISQEAFNSLKTKFKDKDLYTRDDGIVRLNNEAQNFVASWYQDIAVKRGYLKADSDRDGKIDELEARNLNIGFSKIGNYDFYNEDILSIRLSSGTSQYLQINEYEKNTNFIGNHLKFAKSIEEELSNSISADKNFDRKISLEEGLMNDARSKKNFVRGVMGDIKASHKLYLNSTSEHIPKNLVSNRDLNIPYAKLKSYAAAEAQNRMNGIHTQESANTDMLFQNLYKKANETADMIEKYAKYLDFKT